MADHVALSAGGLLRGARRETLAYPICTDLSCRENVGHATSVVGP